jgi:hypothetical protein
MNHEPTDSIDGHHEYTLTPVEREVIRQYAFQAELAQTQLRAALQVLASQQGLNNARLNPDLTKLVEQSPVEAQPPSP